MLKAFIEKIQELTQIEHYFDKEGREYTSKRMVPMEEPSMPVLGLDTLRGLVDYLKSGFDAEEIGGFDDAGDVPCVALHVMSPHLVRAFLPVSEQWKDRFCVAEVKWSRTPFPFGQYLTQEQFIIKMQAMFLPGGSWQSVMDVAGRIVCEDKAELHDDGVAQAVTISRGVCKQSGIILPNPVILKPVRTFTEVDQPESAFVFRMQSDPVTLSLHEADMGAWEMEAKENIRKYLVAELPGIPVFV